ncbi:MAG TPA: hypothetical protein VFR58_16240 [Flavisolibacter sp.]|nr:hypothetical protein [Flavisolibacter sp.]
MEKFFCEESSNTGVSGVFRDENSDPESLMVGKSHASDTSQKLIGLNIL